MKKLLLVIACLMLIAGSANATRGYLALYADDSRASCSYYYDNVPAAAIVNVYIFGLDNPGVGATCIEFAMSWPAGWMAFETIYNPDKSVTVGDIDTGIAICNFGCHSGWYWYAYKPLYHLTVVTDYVNLNVHSGTGEYRMTDCSEPDVVKYDEVILLNNLALNQECLISTKPSSWGAIKSMYEE